MGLLVGLGLLLLVLVLIGTRRDMSPEARLAREQAAPAPSTPPPPVEPITPAPTTQEQPLTAANLLPTPAAEAPAQTPPTEPAPTYTPPPPTPTPPPVSPPKYHVVVAGDTLSGISQQYYKTTTRWRDIVTANKNVLTDPNRLRLGMRLVIPE
ncbi:LysM peptidoglycan-binding domain-containing protein [Planctomycetota bacterium]